MAYPLPHRKSAFEKKWRTIYLEKRGQINSETLYHMDHSSKLVPNNKIALDLGDISLLLDLANLFSYFGFIK